MMKIWQIYAVIISLCLIFTLIGVTGIEDIEMDGTELITGEIPKIDRDPPEETEIAEFAAACFWGPDAELGAQLGVIKTRVGFTEIDPKYQDLGPESELVQVVYDPDKISYLELLSLLEDEGDPSMFNPLAMFDPADDSQQKHILRQNETFYELYREIYPDIDDFINSTATARVNGYLAGYGELDSPSDLYDLGLTRSGRILLYNTWKDASLDRCET